MMAGAVDAKPEGFGASHTSFYTSAKAKDKYATLDEILNEKMSDAGVREVVKDMLNACVKITEALRVNLVTVADAQNSVFGDVQLGVDVIADKLMWEACKSSKVVQTGASEEEPVLVEVNKDGRFVVCWDPLDGSSIVDNNWAVGTMIGLSPHPPCSLTSATPMRTLTWGARQASGTRRLACSARLAATRCSSSSSPASGAFPTFARIFHTLFLFRR